VVAVDKVTGNSAEYRLCLKRSIRGQFCLEQVVVLKEIYLVRHGQASFGAANYDQLSPLGHQQSVWLGEYYRERAIDFDRVLVGDLVRQRETADRICQGMARSTHDFTVLPELNEFNFGGLVDSYLTRFPDEGGFDDKSDRRFYFRTLKKAIALWQRDELHAPAIESWQVCFDRVAGVLQRLQASADGERLLVVSSGGIMAMAVTQILKAAPETVIELNLQIKNTGVINLIGSSNSLRLSGFNHLPHLDRADRLTAVTYS